MTARVPDDLLAAYQKWEPGGRVTDLETGDDADHEIVQQIAERLRQDLKRCAADLQNARVALRRALAELGFPARDYCEGDSVWLPDGRAGWLTNHDDPARLLIGECVVMAPRADLRDSPLAEQIRAALPESP